MHYLITGGAGFIGSHLTESLIADGHQVTIIDDFNDYYDPAIKRNNLSAVRERITLVEADIRDKEAVDQLFNAHRFDSIIHLAARAGVRPSIDDPELYVSTNINGTLNLLEACRRHDVTHFLLASSSSVYGVNKKTPFAEHDPIERTISPYAATKMACEHLCSNYAYLYGIRCTCLRFFTVYGPRQRPDLAISKFTRRILDGQSIDKFGAGQTARDYTHVLDIVQGIRAAIEHRGPAFDTFNIGGSETTTLNQLIDLIEEATGKRAIINQLPEQPGDVPRTYADISKAQDQLNYQVKRPIQQGIKDYVQWLQSQA